MTAKMIQLPFNSTFCHIPCKLPFLIFEPKTSQTAIIFALMNGKKIGLGPAVGFGIILPTGLWVIFREQQFSIERGVCNGPTVEVDALPTEDIDDLLNEVLNAFGLTHADVQTKGSRIRRLDLME